MIAPWMIEDLARLRRERERRERPHLPVELPAARPEDEPPSPRPAPPWVVIEFGAALRDRPASTVRVPNE